MEYMQKPVPDQTRELGAWMKTLLEASRVRTTLNPRMERLTTTFSIQIVDTPSYGVIKHRPSAQSVV